MDSITRQLRILCLAALAAAIPACASNSVSQCEATGILCPSGMHCAAAQPICISDRNLCGNAHMDPGEVCDDGNNLPGDGCSPDCKSDEKCGNGTLDTPIKDDKGVLVRSDPRNEDCDTPLAIDPNTGKFCSAACKFEVCGNGVTDKEVGEVCDDGNTVGGDGCSADCKSTEQCGNGILDQPIRDANGHPDLADPRNEICDDHNTMDGDGCAHDCRSTENCGNGKIDPGEECDDGKAPDGSSNNADDRDCRSDCVLNRCGDGRPNLKGSHKEECDGGPLLPDHNRGATPTERADCNADCTAPHCGDGKVNHSFLTPDGPEQCDNGAANSEHADCTNNCQINVCGDNHVNTDGPLHKEGCDDGNRIDTDNCTNACILKSCGDGIVGPGEECDLGPNNSDTGACLKNCMIAVCGDGKVETNVEECDGTPGCSTTCRIQRCGNGIIDPGEECDNGNKNDDNGDCRSDCVLNRCGDGHVNTKGAHREDCDRGPLAGPGDHTVTPTETVDCNINCTTPRCGDGIVNRHFTPSPLVGTPVLSPEQCDNLGRVEGNNCSADCQFERCGNGIVDPGEQCDSTPGCSSTCFRQECGNGILDPGEECDNGPGNNGNDKDCRADCIINRCGDGFVNSHGTHVEDCDDAPQAAAHDRSVAPIDTQTCNANCKAPSCGDNYVNHAFTPMGGPGSEQCDPPGPGCTLACRLENCGNGVPDPGEQCDDGNGHDGDGCENDCTLPRCGNHIVDVGEDCDDGNSSNADDCTNDCKFAKCGDGFLRTVATPPPASTPTIVEACDGVLGTIACTWHQTSQACSTCSVCVLQPQIAPFCGDGNTDSPFETCDSRNATCGACSPDCQVVTSHQASGLIFAAAGKDLKATDTFTVSDGFHVPTTFAFTTTSSLDAGPVVTIPFTAGDTNADMAGAIRTAINNARTGGGLQVSAIRQGSVVILTNDRASSKGNGTTLDPRIVSLVETTNFAVVDMSGGEGGDCDLGAACAIDADCASNSCSTTTPHVCQ